MPTCAEGHDTEATDYCDVCGSPVTAGVRDGVPSVQRTDQRPLL